MSLSEQQLAAQKNLSYVLAEKLAQQIMAGEYAAGTILPGEMELGALFGVSRTAVREAVKTLTAKGMLLPRPRIGTRVLPKSQWNFLDKELITWWISKENQDEVMRDFLVMRHSVEPQACFLAAQKGNDTQRERLSDLMQQMIILKLQFDKQRWIEVDMAYHELIYEMSHNVFMISFANLFQPVYFHYFTTITHDRVIHLSQHQAIVDAVIGYDAQRAFNACVALLNESSTHPK